MLKKRLFGPAAVALVVVATLAACGNGSGAGSTPSQGGIPVRIGIMGGESSRLPATSFEAIRGAEMARGDLSGLGLDVTFIPVDDRGTPEGAAQAAQRLINNDEVDFILGPGLSGQVLQVRDLVQTVGRPWCLSLAAGDDLAKKTDAGNWAFQTAATAAQAIEVFADGVVEPDDTVGLLAFTDTYGQIFTRSMEKTWADRGLGDIAVTSFDQGAADLSVQARTLRDAGVDTVIIGVHGGDDFVPILRAFDQADFHPKAIYTTGAIVGSFAKVATPEQRSAIKFAVPAVLTGPEVEAFTAEYVSTYGEDPTYGLAAQMSYSCVDAYLRAVKEAGTATDYTAVRDAMEKTASLDIFGTKVTAPFSAEDHRLWDFESSPWGLYGFDPSSGAIIEAQKLEYK
ncbi:ABC transporter substrate-binding protein [Arthrobacter sp. ISL-28]|uniref:ABC transporter substrate-binding protein n=1 Tax=Arthrobacter sp. ISL-28 TaxID=2819108 RepID=UPI001BEB851D|nr:ABC transporter substrate-binding protein [Arthrobacter sp. ISL-28]MBT2523311.1 ABC transporter substrate-binding protein [Arthrobacter sp. ISL-28]